MGTHGRHWAKKVRIVEDNEVFKSARALAIWLEVDVSYVYKVLRGDRESINGKHLEWVLE